MALAGSDQECNLKIGDVVLLYYSADGRLMSDSAGRSGFIIADLSGSASQQLLTLTPAEGQEDLPNLHFGTFKVISSNKYEAQTHHRTLLERLKELKRKKAGQGAIQLLQLQVSQAKRDSEVERAENAAKQRRLQGSNVYYGDSIQLLHTHTGRYVCVSATDTSKTENTKLRVYLQKKDSVGCIFRLHPHIKVQTIGEEVNYDDQIKFESVATEGQYLHCSKKTFGDININAFSYCYEVNVAAKESPLKIIHHYHPTSGRKAEMTLKGSGIARFFHSKHQCYIVGEGSFAGRYSKLPKMESQDADANIASHFRETIRRRSSSPRATRKVHVTADMEQEPESKTELQVPGTELHPVHKLTRQEEYQSSKTELLDASKDDVVVEDVHFRRKVKTGSITSQASTSPNTFWQIEKFKDPLNGESMKWSEECRIKHLPTRRYLAVTDKLKVTLKSNTLPPSSTVFVLFPVVQQAGGEIHYGCHVRVKHRDTETWLHLNKDLHYVSKPKTGEDTIDEDTEEVDDAATELFKVVATKQIKSDDCFTLEKVENYLVSDFNYIADITAVLVSQLEQCESLGGEPHSPEDCHMRPALSSLQFLSSLLVRDKEHLKNKQKVIRCMRTLVLVIRLLNLHRNENSNDPEVCTACFGVIINFLEGKSKKNKSYLASMMNYIFTSSVKDTELIGTQTVEKALVGIARDNLEVLNERMLMIRIIDYVMQKLRGMDRESPKSVQLFEILSELCAYQGVPIHQNQLIILEQLQKAFEEDGSSKLFYPLRVEPRLESIMEETEEQVAIQLEEGDIPLIDASEWKKKKKKEKARRIQFQSVRDLRARRGSDSDSWCLLNQGSKWFHKIVVAQLNLLIQMCNGSNARVIEALQDGSIGIQMDFNLMMCAMKDSVISDSYPLLRAAFVELLKVMYVEVGENRPYLEKIPFSFKINEVGRVPFESSVSGTDPGKAAITALTGIENPHFPTIKEWIEDFFKEEAEYFFAADENDKNEVVVKVLEVLTSLVKFGYYDDCDDLEPLLPALHKLLNGKEDFPTQEIKAFMECTFKEVIQRKLNKTLRRRGSSKRKANSMDNDRHVFDQDAVDIEEEMAGDELATDSQKEKILTEFREGGKRYKYTEKRKNHFKIKHWAMEILNLLFNFQLYKSLHSFIYDFRWLAQTSSVQLQEELEANEFEMVAIKNPGKLKNELSTLITTNPQDPKFLKETPKLAKKIIASAKSRLKFITMRVDSLDLSFEQHLPEILLDLANYKYQHLIQHSLLLLDRYFSSQSDIFNKALQTQLLLTPQSIQFYNTIEKLFIDLMAFLRSGSGAVNTGQDPSPVEVLTEHCWLEAEVEGFEPHQVNQNIILSFGIFPDILNYVLDYCDGELYVDQEYKEKLIECLALLRALACQNITIQARLLYHLDAFIKAVPGELGPYIGELFCEIFKGGPSITLSLKEDQLWQMINLIFARGNESFTDTHAVLLDAFHELLIVKELGLPLKHNQLIVTRFISSIRDDIHYWCKDLLAEGRAFLRWEILTGKDDANPRLHNLLMITDLLATCAYGGNIGVESVCCTIYSEEELVTIIGSNEISLYRKRPFMRLLVGVYMNVQGIKAEEKALVYRRNANLWLCMNKICDVMLEMSVVMREMPHSSYLTVKEQLASSSWKYLHCCPDRKHNDEPPRIIMEGENVYSEHFHVADLLTYIVEGFFPFLQVFFGEFCTPEMLVHDNKSTETIYKMVLSLHPVFNCKRVYFSQEDQVKLYYRVLFLLHPYRPSDLSEEFLELEEEIEDITDYFHQEVVSEARERYQALYEEEKELNETFSQFVYNYKSAYEGRNTRVVQIIDTQVKHNKDYPYSDFLDEDMKKPGPKFLPLGRSFQEHVAIFNPPDSKSKEMNPKEQLLKQLEISLSKNLDTEEQVQLDIKCLQILRATVYNQIILINEEDRERNPKKYRRQCEHHLHPVQNGIQDLGNAASRVVPLLSHSDEKIVYEVLAFLEALLEFGNTHVRDGLKEIIKTREHQIFPTLKAILKRANIIYKESQALVGLLKGKAAADTKIVTKTEAKEEEDEEDAAESQTATMSEWRRGSKEKETTSLVSPQHRMMSSIGVFTLRRKKPSSKPLVTDDRRVPFMALYHDVDDTDEDIGSKADKFLHCYDLSRICLISRVLGLMCDGQCKEMQNYLRTQGSNVKSVNMVEEIASFVYEFTKKQVFNIETITLFNHLVEALTKFCIGNRKNREVAFNGNVISAINYVLHIDITKIMNKETGMFSWLGLGSDREESTIDYVTLRKMALEMKAAVVLLLDALLEEIGSKSSSLSHQIADGLDIASLHWSMLDFFILKSDPDLIRLEFDDNASRALFNAYKIIQQLADNGFASIETLTPTEKAVMKAWEYCEERSRSIEVVYRDEDMKDEVLIRVHFNVNVESDISDQMKETVKYQVDRSTHGDKLRDFHEWMHAVKKDTFHRDWLKRKHLTSVELFSTTRYWLLLLTALVLNIFFIVYFVPAADTEEPCPLLFVYMNGSITPNPDLAPEYITADFILSALYAVLTVWMLVEYFMLTWPHFVLPEILYTVKSYCKKRPYLSWISKILILPRVERTYSSVSILGVKTLYLLSFLVIAASPFFCFGYLYFISFFYIIINNDILQRALQSVTKNWKSLVWVAILLLIILYAYAVISFALLRTNLEDPENSRFCYTIDQCFVSVLRFGLIDSFLEVGVNDANDARARLFFDISFFIIITTIGLNIVFGIIIDTFSELRDARFTAEQDMKSTCFICGLPSHEFDKLGNNGFERHYLHDHNMWSYIYYSIYLDHLDVTNHNAIERYVYEKMQVGSIDYFPFEKALVFEESEKGDELLQEVERLERSVNETFETMRQRFDTIESLLRAKDKS